MLFFNEGLASGTQWTGANKLVNNAELIRCMVVGLKHTLQMAHMLHLTLRTRTSQIAGSKYIPQWLTELLVH